MRTESLATGMRRVFIDDAMQARFEHDGYVVVDCLSASQVDELLDEWNCLSDEIDQAGFSSSLMSRNIEYRNKVHEIVGSRLASPASTLLLRYRMVMCNFLNKRPGQRNGMVEMHQDWTFVDEERYYSIGIWCPLVDVDRTNGCLRIVPGSHRLNRRPRGFHRTFPYTELLPLLEERYITDVPMEAGQAFIYTQTLFHSSPLNNSQAERVVAGALFVPEESQMYFLMPQQESGMLGVYAVPDDFYRTLMMGSTPPGDWLVKTCVDEYEQLTGERLHEILWNA